ncbi:MAG: hypothetical protein EOP64_03490 [Sphingomonas sp.]|nr:MAG: hypothetical protein EOP64_03490 [Sphingomonas sp.]
MPAGTAVVWVERRSRAFTKYLLDDGRVLHRFRAGEPYANPHDHPWPFVTEILEGGYIEEVFRIGPDGWHSEQVHRLPGQVYRIEATHIYRIVALPTGECWTLVKAGGHEPKTRFWRFETVVRSRAWHDGKWIVG